MKPIFIGVSGGTGAGKSTLCTALMDKYPDKVGLIQLDDYFKPSDQVPTFEGHENWDHPDSLFLDKLSNDLAKLSEGESIVINTKNERLNPDYKRTDQRIPVKFHPKPIMFVEGYLVLQDERIKKYLTASIWLDLDHKTRWERRAHFKDTEYEEKVLQPMHKEFVRPTKQYATHIINISNLTKDEVLEKTENLLKNFLQQA